MNDLTHIIDTLIRLNVLSQNSQNLADAGYVIVYHSHQMHNLVWTIIAGLRIERLST